MGYTDKQIKYIKVLREETDLDWTEIADEWNQKYSHDAGKKTLNALRKLYKRYQDDEVADDVLIKNIKTTFTARKTASQLRRENRAIVETLTNFDDVIDAIETLKNTKLQKPRFKKRTKRSRKKPGMTMEALLSDLHYGLKTKTFDSGVLRERLQRYTQAFIKSKEREEKNYNIDMFRILLNGDIIQSATMHKGSHSSCDLTNAEQIAIAVESIYFDVILPLAEEGYPVEVIGMSGNHDREQSERFTVDPGKHYFTWAIYKGIENLCKAGGLKNVKFEIPLKAYHVYECYGNHFLVEHGDWIKKATPEALEQKLMQRSAQVGKILKGIRIGHFHNDFIGNVGRYIVNPSPVSDDHFGDGLGYVSRPAQIINYYVETDKRDTCYYHSFVVNLS